jgi:hypothetical protein
MDNKKNINIEIIQNYTQDMINITKYYIEINKAEYYTEINKPLNMFVFEENRTYFKENIKLDISYQEISSFMLPEYYKQEPRTNHIMTIYYLFEPIQLMGI